MHLHLVVVVVLMMVVVVVVLVVVVVVVVMLVLVVVLLLLLLLPLLLFLLCRQSRGSPTKAMCIQIHDHPYVLKYRLCTAVCNAPSEQQKLEK